MKMTRNNLYSLVLRLLMAILYAAFFGGREGWGSFDSHAEETVFRLNSEAQDMVIEIEKKGNNTI